MGYVCGIEVVKDFIWFYRIKGVDVIKCLFWNINKKIWFKK